MSKHDWKPGDIALVDYGPAQEVMMRDHHGWMSATSEVSDTDGDITVRPLVVLDPDDREQVERLTGSLFEAGLVGRSVIRPGDRDAVAAALRSLVAPPRPTEPTEVGALVKDAGDNLWVRTAWSTWRCISEPDMRGQVWSGLDSPELVQR